MASVSGFAFILWGALQLSSTQHGISRSEYAAQSRDEHRREKELKKIEEYNQLAGSVQEQVFSLS